MWKLIVYYCLFYGIQYTYALLYLSLHCAYSDIEDYTTCKIQISLVVYSTTCKITVIVTRPVR